jgi:hypothetical protein
MNVGKSKNTQQISQIRKIVDAINIPLIILTYYILFYIIDIYITKNHNAEFFIYK